MQPIRIGILGVGTVGGGTVKLLQTNAAEIARRLGREVVITRAASRNLERAQRVCGSDIMLSTEVADVVTSADVDVVVELIGGTTVAKDAVVAAISNGKHVVTANKKLLAEHGNEIFALAEQNNVMVMFEAAVAGGIPIIKALREGLAANQIESIAGIINGTAISSSPKCASTAAPLPMCSSRHKSWAMPKPTPLSISKATMPPIS